MTFTGLLLFWHAWLRGESWEIRCGSLSLSVSLYFDFYLCAVVSSLSSRCCSPRFWTHTPVPVAVLWRPTVAQPGTASFSFLSKIRFPFLPLTRQTPVAARLTCRRHVSAALMAPPRETARGEACGEHWEREQDRRHAAREPTWMRWTRDTSSAVESAERWVVTSPPSGFTWESHRNHSGELGTGNCYQRRWN